MKAVITREGHEDGEFTILGVYHGPDEDAVIYDRGGMNRGRGIMESAPGDCVEIIELPEQLRIEVYDDEVIDIPLVDEGGLDVEAMILETAQHPESTAGMLMRSLIGMVVA